MRLDCHDIWHAETLQAFKKKSIKMDVTEKVNLVSRPPTEEVVTKDELLELFNTQGIETKSSVKI